METFFKNLSIIGTLVGVTINKVSQKLDFDNPLNRNINEILENPIDKKRLDKAIESLKKDSSKKYEEVTLSDNEKIIISIS